MPKALGICGPSGSGKSTLAARLFEVLAAGSVSIHSQDAYYRDMSHLPSPERDGLNFDHPAAVDWGLLASQLTALREGREIDEPIYDFREHSRRGARRVSPGHDVVIIDGHLLFSAPEVLQLLDLKIYLEADLDLLLLRRVLRDTRERGRSVESVCRQYLDTVRPMYFEHVSQGKSRADLVISTSADPDRALRETLGAVAEFLGIGVAGVGKRS